MVIGRTFMPSMYVPEEKKTAAVFPFQKKELRQAAALAE